MKSLDGIFIANSIDPNVMEEHKQEINEQMISETESIGETEHNKKIHSNPTTEVVDNFVHTHITFNKGGKWSLITAPERDSLGKKYDCGEYCYLNLQGSNSKYPPLYSVENAVGLSIANGNVGKYLSQNEEDISTFLSRDGGLNWFEVIINHESFRLEKVLIFMR